MRGTQRQQVQQGKMGAKSIPGRREAQGAFGQGAEAKDSGRRGWIREVSRSA